MRYVRFLILAAAAVLILTPSVAAQNGPLPYVQQILIGPKADALPVVRPICPDDSIQVRVLGAFPDACYKVSRVELIFPPYGSPLPEPPFVRLHVVKQCGVACATVITPFEADAILPPLPPRDYGLVAQLDERCEDDPNPPDSLYQTRVPFRVETCDGTGATCLWGGWVHPGPDACDATVAYNQPADVTFTIQSSVALAGLQGEFHLAGNVATTSPLVIHDIGPVGPAAGMHLSWSATTDGARFVLFADSGAPIPAAGLGSGEPPVPILRLTLAASGLAIPPLTFVTAGALLGSDADGQGVPICPIRIAAVAARVCAESGCDFNGDGRTDIRDLVLMVRCLTDETRCDMTRFHDCNGDGQATLADVICCARRILAGPRCPGCAPDTVPPVAAPQVKVKLGAARFEQDAVDVPLNIEGLGNVGGALVTLDYPADRYDAAIVFPDGSTQWLQVDDVSGGHAGVGLVRMAQGDAADPGTITLHLTLKSGQSHGGEVTVGESEFSGTWGEPLEVSLDSETVELSGPARIALSEGRPNPFTGETRFALTLDRPGTATLRVLDLSGRVVATLHDGPLSAGEHAFVWDGRTAGGASAPAGIYFLRAASGAGGVTKKLVRLHD